MYGSGGWYRLSVNDQTLPVRLSSTVSNSAPAQAGLRQNCASAGKK